MLLHLTEVRMFLLLSLHQQLRATLLNINDTCLQECYGAGTFFSYILNSSVSESASLGLNQY